MKVIAFFISITLVSVLSQNSPCKWTSAQWTSFKECVGAKTKEAIEKCVAQQSTAKDWFTIRNTICSDQSKKGNV